MKSKTAKKTSPAKLAKPVAAKQDATDAVIPIVGIGAMVQEPSTAKYDGLPKSAISAGYATHILPVEKMPAMLLEITRHNNFRRSTAPIAPMQIGMGLPISRSLIEANGGQLWFDQQERPGATFHFTLPFAA
jgi:hypothetical protein